MKVDLLKFQSTSRSWAKMRKLVFISSHQKQYLALNIIRFFIVIRRLKARLACNFIMFVGETR